MTSSFALVAALAALAAMALFGLAAWFMRRRDSAPGWLALSALAWLAFCLKFMPFANPVWSGSVRTAIDIGSATGLLLIPAYAGATQAFFRLPKMPRWALGAFAVVIAAGIAGLALGGPGMGVSASLAVLSLAALALTLAAVRETVRRPIAENALISIAVALAAAAVAVEFVAKTADWPVSDSGLVPALAVGSVAAMGLAVMRRIVTAVSAEESRNVELAQRIEKTKANLLVSEQARRSLEVASAITHERERIMREIHDGIGSSLVAALASAERQGKQSTTAVVALRSALTDLRIAVDSLQPVEGNVATLLASLRYRLEPELRKAGIAIEWMVNDVPELEWLDAPNALHILRIFQEAFSNALGHSNATRIRVGCRLDIDDGRPGVCIEVADNGGGFDPSSSGHGQGRKNMHERAEALAGKLTVTSTPGAGSAVVLWLPFLRAKSLR